MDRKRKTAIIGTAAAIAAAGWATLHQIADPPEPEKQAQFVDDVKPIQVNVPKVTGVKVNVPKVTAVQAGGVKVKSAAPKAAAVALPKVELPKVAPRPVELPRVQTANAELDAQVQRMKTFLPLVRDKRSLYSADFSRSDNPDFAAWSKIYQDKTYLEYQPEEKELAGGLRIINEIRAPRDGEEFLTLQQRLAYYKQRGYNAVLVSFDTTESLGWLAIAADYAKSEGFKIILTYAGGGENLKFPVWRDPATLRTWLATLGEHADALLLGWRRTSPHLFLPDKVFSNFLIRSARERNPELPFIGIAYFGVTAETTRGDVTYCVPEGAAAVLVVGIGYPRSSTKSVLKKMFPEVIGHKHLIGLAVGEKPYFDSQHNTGRSRAENEAIQRRIELRLLAAGCASTMTYSGDGSDGAYGDETKTENLCRKYGR